MRWGDSPGRDQTPILTECDISVARDRAPAAARLPKLPDCDISGASDVALTAMESRNRWRRSHGMPGRCGVGTCC